MESPRSARRALTLAALLLLAAAPLAAQERVLVQGVLDVEGWATDSSSRLLARNDGRAAALGRLCVWSAVEPVTGLVLYAQGEVEGGPAAAERVELSLEQAGVRWTRSRALVVDAGMIAPIVGVYANRHLSTRNPLVGEPDGYSIQYPLGARVSGKTAWADYRLGVISVAPNNERYMPKATPSPHLAAGFGVSPSAGLRFGVSGAAGSWMDRGLGAALQGRSWRSYRERVLAADAQASAGYLELRAEGSRAWYDVPGHARMVVASAWYGEGVFAWTPRLFTALRVERNDYPFLKPFGTAWPARMARVDDAEAGVGYRVGASQTLKLSYRRDRWHVATARRFPDGHAVAVQLSSGFDLLDALTRARTR
jgi:hypothetical protein